MIGQVVMTCASKFSSAIAFQMIENLPFFHSLAITAISNQGYGIDSLSTLFFLYGLSTAMVGIVFYLLGKFDLGRVVYFFPNHVLVGCIGGIGVFIIIAAIEVTSNVKFNWDYRQIIENVHLLGVVLLFEGVLRVLTWTTKGRVPLLAPIYFCAVPFLFYGFLYLLRVDIADAEEAGYFFASPTDEGNSSTESLLDRVFNVHTFDLVRVVNFKTISWKAVYESIGTMVALSAFSLIHVPINIPGVSSRLPIPLSSLDFALNSNSKALFSFDNSLLDLDESRH
jgi:sulfate permease, SulP family